MTHYHNDVKNDDQTEDLRTFQPDDGFSIMMTVIRLMMTITMTKMKNGDEEGNHPLWTFLHVSGSPRQVDQAPSQHVNLIIMLMMLIMITALLLWHCHSIR